MKKVQGKTERLRPKNLKDLRSFLGPLDQMNKFIQKLALLCFSFRDILTQIQSGLKLMKKRLI